jgi:radical SAM protein with 4Fe4S-binding SPASM domain
MFGENGEGCSNCRVLNILGVLANGLYAMCGIGEVVPGLVYGNAATDSLADVWADNPVLVELREGLPRNLGGICSKCLFKRRCMGACVAQNYYTTRSFWNAHWYCNEACSKGLFPRSRIFPEGFVPADAASGTG